MPKLFLYITACVVLILAACAVLFLNPVRDANLVAWNALPVLDGGRVMPVSTLAKHPKELLLSCLAEPSARQEISSPLPTRSLQLFNNAAQTLAASAFTDARMQIETFLSTLVNSKGDALHQNFHQLLAVIDIVINNAEILQRCLYTTDTINVSEQFSQIVVASRHPAHRRDVLLASIELGAAARQMRREVEAAWLSLGAADNTIHTIRVLPITTAADILSTRIESLTPPWLSLTSLIHGHPLFIERFLGIRSDDTTLARVRQAWRDAVLTQFATELRLLAKQLEPQRCEMPNADALLLQKTAYPAQYIMSLECHYNSLSPFFWMVILAAGSIVAVLVAMITTKEIAVVCSVCSIALLAVSSGITAYGGVMRAIISGWVPATNMYETIILMAWMTMLFGLFANITKRRLLLLLVTAAIAVIAGTVAMLNAEFNPAIRPLAAVLRSNFWLTTHVVVIMASYSAALVVWGLSWVAVLAALFGHHDRSLTRAVAPLLIPLMLLTLLLLALGIVLGGRWADYSWGRFWGWDPKEVWALITMLYYAVIIHGARRRLFGALGVAVGGQLGGIAVVTTWYGINYVFRAGMHAYAGGSTTGATLFLYTFIAVHIGVAALVTFRYVVERDLPDDFQPQKMGRFTSRI